MKRLSRVDQSEPEQGDDLQRLDFYSMTPAPIGAP